MNCKHSPELWKLKRAPLIGDVEGLWCTECEGYVVTTESGEGELYWKARTRITERALARTDLLFWGLLISITLLTLWRGCHGS
jgi:hypothetical protein